MAIGSPLSPTMANLFMEHFEEKALESYPLKVAWWKRFVDDTNVKLLLGIEEIEKFSST